jgi:hypothetical protein
MKYKQVPEYGRVRNSDNSVIRRSRLITNCVPLASIQVDEVFRDKYNVCHDTALKSDVVLTRQEK